MEAANVWDDEAETHRLLTPMAPPCRCLGQKRGGGGSCGGKGGGPGAEWCVRPRSGGGGGGGGGGRGRRGGSREEDRVVPRSHPKKRSKSPPASRHSRFREPLRRTHGSGQLGH